jgi:hypothetical protein
MTLPGELERLLNDLGFNWPEIDEQRLFELGGSWSSYSARRCWKCRSSRRSSR